MALFAVLFAVGNYRHWFGRIIGATAMLLVAGTYAKADTQPDTDGGAATFQLAALHTDPGTAAKPGVVEQQGVASWYGRHWRGRKTASGVRFDERLLTAASPTLPLATRAHVT